MSTNLNPDEASRILAPDVIRGARKRFKTIDKAKDLLECGPIDLLYIQQLLDGTGVYVI